MKVYIRDSIYNVKIMKNTAAVLVDVSFLGLMFLKPLADVGRARSASYDVTSP